MAKHKKSKKPATRKTDVDTVAPEAPADGDTRTSRRRRRHLQPFAVVPILFTLGNLVAGFAAIHFAAKPLEFDVPLGSSLSLAGLCVFIGMFFDAVDGSVARFDGREWHVTGASSLGAKAIRDVACHPVAGVVVATEYQLRWWNEAEWDTVTVDISLNNRELKAVAVTRDGVWIVATDSGVLVASPTGQRSWLEPRQGLLGERVRDLYVDRQDRLWIGYVSDGLQCIPLISLWNSL